MSKSVVINTAQELEAFSEQAVSGKCQEIELVHVSNISISPSKIQELSSLLPNLKEFNHNEPTYNVYGTSGQGDEDDEDEDEHGACGCCRTDRYE